MNMLKKMKLGGLFKDFADMTFQELNHKISKALYAVTLEITKHTMVKLGEKFTSIPLSNNTIQRRFIYMAIDTKSQVIQEIKSTTFGLFDCGGERFLLNMGA